MLAAGVSEAIGDEDEGPLRKRLAVTTVGVLPIQDRSQRQLVPPMAGGQDGPPSPSLRGRELIDAGPARRRLTVLQQANQRIQVRGQQVLAPQMQHDALPDLPAGAIIFDQAEISVITRLGLAEEHRNS